MLHIWYVSTTGANNGRSSSQHIQVYSCNYTNKPLPLWLASVAVWSFLRHPRPQSLFLRLNCLMTRAIRASFSTLIAELIILWFTFDCIHCKFIIFWIMCLFLFKMCFYYSHFMCYFVDYIEYFRSKTEEHTFLWLMWLPVSYIFMLMSGIMDKLFGINIKNKLLKEL
jgi:hypothetical protein